MNLEIPDTLLETNSLTEQDLKNALAFQLVRQNLVSLDQASRLFNSSPDKLMEWIATPHPAAKTGQLDMDAFLSWASHDLKTPLNSIIGFSRIILKGIDGPVSDLQTADLTLINSSGQRMLTLLNQLVEMARLNRAEIVAKKEQTGILPLIEVTVDNWRQKNPEHELLTNFATPDPAPMFKVDLTQVRQVIIHLLTYAGLHITPGGQIHFSLETSATALTLTIRSSGVRSNADVKMEAAMLSFISQELLRLNDGELELCQADENGAHIRFVL